MSGDLANAIARDILAERKPAQQFPTCFVCGRSHSRGDGRFSSSGCRAGFDAGVPRCEAPDDFYSLPPRGDGFVIECAGCRKTFVSRGLRSCSIDCERQYREHHEIAAIVQEVGGELPEKRKCEQSGGDIPRYRGVGKARREVKKTTRFCSDRCAKRARKQSGGLNPVVAPESAKKSLSPSVSQSAPADPSPAAERVQGRHQPLPRRPQPAADAVRLDRRS
jgi:hypothetical protein